MTNYEVELFKQVNLAKELFFAYNKRIEAIISFIKEHVEKSNNNNEGDSVGALEKPMLRYSIMTEGYKRHVSILRIDNFNDSAPVLAFMMYYNAKNDSWEDWEKEDEIEGKLCIEEPYISQCTDPDPDARWTFAVYTRPITDFRNEASCLNTIKEVNNTFKELIKMDIEYFIRLDNK